MPPFQAAENRFQAIVEIYSQIAGISPGRMFSSTALKVHGKVFALLVRGRLVVKLPKAKIDELVVLKRGSPFDPGHGRPMKEWISIEMTSDETEWPDLVKAAKAFVLAVP
jgi:TfoX/Sxy family transcriptional regulator of competence genes